MCWQEHVLDPVLMKRIHDATLMNRGVSSEVINSRNLMLDLAVYQTPGIREAVLSAAAATMYVFPWRGWHAI